VKHDTLQGVDDKWRC